MYNNRQRSSTSQTGRIPQNNVHKQIDIVKQALMNFTKGDNKLLSLSRAYNIDVDTGWDVPPGVMHAPASMCTYEPQFASDVYAMYQSVLYFDHAVGEELLWKNCPEDKKGDFDYLVEAMDWDVNVDPYFYKNRRMAPIPVGDSEETAKEGYFINFYNINTSAFHGTMPK